MWKTSLNYYLDYCIPTSLLVSSELSSFLDSETMLAQSSHVDSRCHVFECCCFVVFLSTKGRRRGGGDRFQKKKEEPLS